MMTKVNTNDVYQLNIEFSSPSPDMVIDASALKNHGELQGAKWVSLSPSLQALEFDGSSRIRFPASAMPSPSANLTIEIWADGFGVPLHWSELSSGSPPMRDPVFQVVGDRIYMATNSDIPNSVTRKREAHELVTGWKDTAGVEVLWTHHQLELTDKWGNALHPIEPKMQVVGGKIHYFFSR